jgi:hypothetical protein
MILRRSSTSVDDVCGSSRRACSIYAVLMMKAIVRRSYNVSRSLRSSEQYGRYFWRRTGAPYFYALSWSCFSVERHCLVRVHHNMLLIPSWSMCSRLFESTIRQSRKLEKSLKRKSEYSVVGYLSSIVEFSIQNTTRPV